MVQSISFAFALYESSSYGAKLNMITAHHWSPMCVFSFFVPFFLSVWVVTAGGCKTRTERFVHCSNRQSSHSPTSHLSNELQQLAPLYLCNLLCSFFFCLFFFPNFYLLKSPLNASYSLWHALNGLRLNFHNTHLPSSLHKPLAISVSRQLWIMASDCLCRCVHRVTHCWAVPFDTCEHICEYIVVMHVESSSLPRIALPSSHTYQVILPLPCIGQSHPCA